MEAGDDQFSGHRLLPLARPQLLSLSFLLLLSSAFPTATAKDVLAAPGDAAAMRALAKSLDLSAATFLWNDSSDPCHWPKVGCSGDGLVQTIQIGHSKVAGFLTPDIRNLSALTRLELMSNAIGGPLPSLGGLSNLQFLAVHDNLFTSIPDDLFAGLSGLQNVYLDSNPLASWSIPDSLRDCLNLNVISGNNVSLTGAIPDFLGNAFGGLQEIAFANNNLTGSIPTSFSGSILRQLWLNGNGLSGIIEVVGNMSSLEQLWLNMNSFSGPLPDFSLLTNLQDLNLRDNQLTGPVPASLISLKSLQKIHLTNNLLQGPVPKFSSTITLIDLDNKDESFCREDLGDCDPRVNILLSIVGSFGYPVIFARSWSGNDPCKQWRGITCDPSGNIIVVNFDNMNLNGTISPHFGSLTFLQKLVLSNNNITGTIASELTKLASLQLLDLSNNSLWGKVPQFGKSVMVSVGGNPSIGKDGPPNTEDGPLNTDDASDGSGKSRTGVILGILAAVVCAVVIIGLVLFCYKKKMNDGAYEDKKENNLVVHPSDSGSDAELLRISVANDRFNRVASNMQAGPSNQTGIQMVEAANLAISIQLLRDVTDDFSEDKILGRGGFGTVYKGKLHDGTMIAVKRMNCCTGGSKGIDEFKSEISVLTKVRHRHLVSLLGYCLEDNEKILVYEYMPQGTLSDHLFNWERAGIKPLEWRTRLSIALDVARGVEYLHTLAHQRFIHRDLKSSNILLGDDMKAKVADFGLVRLAPEGTFSVETKVAGTFGYLAPEYAATGRVTTKSDVYSFGAVLMELITGRKALDFSQPDETAHLVTWFHRMQMDKKTFLQAIDPTIELNDGVILNITIVAELAGHCCGKDPRHRPDMGHAVNVLSSLAESWKPIESNENDEYKIDLDSTLLETFKKWQKW